ncbi:TonB family protein [Chitinophaga sp. S165]|uniref:TonB family protein n=1 Tax=Chitinophaga sp. S165 TaxID=2135462 RepID=UPI000D93AA39|nr:TonB family protein [Chitinophaga sp. S165]PWV53692.1 TonB family protein [Chitinophaga sp. S165]
MNHHVDPELIRRYLAGELDNKAMHALEKQALDDPFLAEALDGYAERKPDQRFHLADLNKRLEMRVQDREEKRGMVFRLNYRWMAAAGVLLLVGISMIWILQRGPDNEIAMHQKATNISDSSITDTLQYYNREEPVAWGKATPEKPLTVSIPSDTGFLPAKEGRISAALAADQPMASAMMRREDTVHQPSPLLPLSDSLKGSMAGVAVTRPVEAVAQAEAMEEKNPVAYAPMVTTRLIQGRVKASNDKDGMPGATVSIEGTGTGAITDSDGNFAIRVADTTKNLKLVVAMVGFDSKKMDLRQKENNLDIVLNQQEKALSEGVVSGYSKSKKVASVYQPPIPVAGYERYKEYLSKNVNYPASAAAGNVTGRVKVSFRVLPDGTLEDFKITRRLQPDCDAEALRVVKEGPEWSPASDGKATRVQVDVHFPPK